MGQQRYAEAMCTGIRFRVTEAQANSLTAMAHAMSLTVGDMIRFAIDELVDDIPEPRLFTQSVQISFHKDRR